MWLMWWDLCVCVWMKGKVLECNMHCKEKNGEDTIEWTRRFPCQGKGKVTTKSLI